jgi:hypothetical protein
MGHRKSKMKTVDRKFNRKRKENKKGEKERTCERWQNNKQRKSI